MLPQLVQPTPHIDKRLLLADVVDQERPHRATVVGGGNGAVSFLSSSVPDLRLDCLGINLNTASRKLDADGRLGIKVELVAREPAQQVGFADSRVSNEYDWEGGALGR
jgi:hypothetical protein